MSLLLSEPNPKQVPPSAPAPGAASRDNDHTICWDCGKRYCGHLAADRRVHKEHHCRALIARAALAGVGPLPLPVTRAEWQQLEQQARQDRGEPVENALAELHAIACRQRLRREAACQLAHVRAHGASRRSQLALVGSRCHASPEGRVRDADLLHAVDLGPAALRPAASATTTTTFDQIANVPRWVAWREEGRNGKPTKVPYSPVSGGKAKPNDPSTWGTRSQAEAKAEQLRNGKGNTGVGIVLGDLGNGFHLIGVDFDSRVDEDGGLARWAEEILALLPSYVEHSPSGTGIKALVGGLNEHVRPFLDLIAVARDKWGAKRSIAADTHEHGPAIEGYCSHRYFAVTGKLWPGKPDSVELLDWPKLGQLARSIQTIRRTRPSSGGGERGRDDTRSAKAFRKGAGLRRAGATFEEMCAALCTDPDPEILVGVREKGEADDMRELHRIWDNAPRLITSGVSLDDFFASRP